jgi:hypothetical protein
MIAGQLAGLGRLTFGNRASQVYLGLVAVVTVWVAADTLFVHRDDASFAGVWLFFLAAPAVFAFFAAGELIGTGFGGSAGFLYAALVVSVLIQSAVLGGFVRLLRGGPGTVPRPRGA